MLICKITQKIIHAALVVLLATLLVSVSAQVIARYFLGFSFQWSEEFPLVIFTWSAFLGAAGALADGQHVALKFVQNLFPSAIRKVIRLLVQFSILGFLIFAIVTGWDLLILFKDYSFITLPFSKQWLFLAVPVSCFLMIPFVIETMISDLRGGRQDDLIQELESEKRNQRDV